MWSILLDLNVSREMQILFLTVGSGVLRDAGQCVTKLSPHDFVILQGHRYLEPPILGVQRRRVKSQHPNSQTPHTSNSVQNCVSSLTTTFV